MKLTDKLTQVEIWNGTIGWQPYDCPPAENGDTVGSYATWCVDEISDYWATINSSTDKIRLNGWKIIDGSKIFD